MMLAAVAAGALFWLNRPVREPKTLNLPGFVDSSSTMEQENRKFHGRLPGDESVRRQFDEANRLAGNGNLQEAAAVLERLADQAGIPLIFNNLGVVYERLGDRARAVNAFRDALARDAGYRLVRENLQKLGDIRSISASP
jgi:tetratricopeptide (TPR) repeat protein